MFGWGNDRRVRRQARMLICQMLVGEQRKLAQLGSKDRPSDATMLPGALADELLGKIAELKPVYFGGQRLPPLTATGVTTEALHYGVDDLASRPNDQRLVTMTLGAWLAHWSQRQAEMNGADFAMWQIAAEAYVRRPNKPAQSIKGVVA